MTQKHTWLRYTFTTGALTGLLLVGASAVSLGAGTVTADALRLRDDHATTGTIVATATKDQTVIVESIPSDGWYEVYYGDTHGYMSSEYITLSTIATTNLGYGKVNTSGDALNLRAQASTTSSVLARIPSYTTLTLDGIDNGWYLVSYNNQTGYVSSDYITIVPSPSTVSTTSTSAATEQEALLDFAYQYLGCRYVYGASGPSTFDCSGFTSFVYKNMGYSINRTSNAQLSNGIAVSKSELQAGDLVFFRYNTSQAVSHVGIYIGDGQFIHASTTSSQVRIDQLNTGHYANVYVYGRRIIGA